MNERIVNSRNDFTIELEPTFDEFSAVLFAQKLSHS